MMAGSGKDGMMTPQEAKQEYDTLLWDSLLSMHYSCDIPGLLQWVPLHWESFHVNLEYKLRWGMGDYSSHLSS